MITISAFTMAPKISIASRLHEVIREQWVKIDRRFAHPVIVTTERTLMDAARRHGMD